MVTNFVDLREPNFLPLVGVGVPRIGSVDAGIEIWWLQKLVASGNLKELPQGI